MIREPRFHGFRDAQRSVAPPVATSRGPSGAESRRWAQELGLRAPPASVMPRTEELRDGRAQALRINRAPSPAHHPCRVGGFLNGFRVCVVAGARFPR